MKKIKIPKCHPDKKFYCKDLCRECYEKQLKEKNPEFWEKQKKNSRDWRKRNKEYSALKAKEYRLKNPLSFERKRNKILKKYGINNLTFRKMLLFQNDKCYICEQPLKETDKFAHVDHCHTTGKVRGILCSQCNWFMSKIDTISDCLLNLQNYVKNQGSLWELQEDTTKEKQDMS